MSKPVYWSDKYERLFRMNESRHLSSKSVRSMLKVRNYLLVYCKTAESKICNKVNWNRTMKMISRGLCIIQSLRRVCHQRLLTLRAHSSSKRPITMALHMNKPQYKSWAKYQVKNSLRRTRCLNMIKNVFTDCERQMPALDLSIHNCKPSYSKLRS